MSKQTILITGVTGFLGSHLTRSLVRSGHNVIILKRSSSNTWRIDDIIDKIICYDINTVDLKKLFQRHKINGVIHCATIYGKKNENISEILDANLYLPVSLLELASSFCCETFINFDTALLKNSNDYSMSKKQFVEWLQVFSDKIRIFNFKLENMYGEMDDFSKIIPFIIKEFLTVSKEINLTKGEQKRDFIYISDVLAAINKLIAKSWNFDKGFHEYEIGSGKAVSIKDTVLLIREMTGNNDTHLNFGALPYRENEVMKLEANIKKSADDLGWSPETPFKDGLCKTIAWYKKHLNSA